MRLAYQEKDISSTFTVSQRVAMLGQRYRICIDMSIINIGFKDLETEKLRRRRQ